MFMSGVFSWNFCTNYKTTGDMDIAVSPSLMGYRDQVREKKSHSGVQNTSINCYLRQLLTIKFQC